MVTFEYEGHEFEIDPANLKDWRVVKVITMIRKNAEPDIFDQIAAISGAFGEHDDEYAAVLGNDIGKMGGLLGAAIVAINEQGDEDEDTETAKN